MSGNRTTDRRALFVIGGVIAVIAVLPWIGVLWTRGSLFGFPVYAFVSLLLAPILLALLAGAGPRIDEIDDGTGEP